MNTQGPNGVDELPDPPATQLVNSAIELFAAALPLQSPKVQEGVLEQLATFLSSRSLDRNPGRRAAVTANIAVALLSVLKVAVRETLAEAGDLRHPTVEKYLQEILQVGQSPISILPHMVLTLVLGVNHESGPVHQKRGVCSTGKAMQ